MKKRKNAKPQKSKKKNARVEDAFGMDKNISFPLTKKASLVILKVAKHYFSLSSCLTLSKKHKKRKT